MTDAYLSDSGLTARSRYPPGPPYIPLDSTSIDSQIGLLRPFLLLRQTTDVGLADDPLLPVAASSGSSRIRSRPKVPVNGKIPIRAAKRKVDDGANGTAVAQPKKKRKKIDLIASMSTAANVE